MRKYAGRRPHHVQDAEAEVKVLGARSKAMLHHKAVICCSHSEHGFFTGLMEDALDSASKGEMSQSLPLCIYT